MANPPFKRRHLLKAGAAAGLTAAGYALLAPQTGGARDSRRNRDDREDVHSPPTTPFVEALPLPPVKQPVSALHPMPGKFPVAGERPRLPHQAWDHYPPRTFYEVHIRESLHSFHPQLPQQKVWGYDGVVPGPTFAIRYEREDRGGTGIGEKAANPCVVRIYNDLPAPDEHTGFGNPEIITHIHNSHNPAESDGFPLEFYHPASHDPQHRGHFLDHHVPNIRSYRQTESGTRFPATLGTIWYHDHCEAYTAANVYKGLAGFWILFDEVDSGNEHDPNPEALRLPSGLGQYDIPLVFQDKSFDSGGYLFFDQMDVEGKPGDKFLVNGKIQPYFQVERRKYRFRMLNGSTLRIYDLYLTQRDRNQEFFRIASDGNLLREPLMQNNVLFGPAERADIVIDFSQYPVGTQLFMVNRLEMKNGRKPTSKLLDPGIPILRFDVVSDPAEPDTSRVPPILREQPRLEDLDLSQVVNRRLFKFDRRRGLWTINNLGFSDTPIATTRRGDDEIWTFKTSGGWAHPIHVHMEEGRILTRNGKIPPPEERGRKDVFMLFPGDEVSILINFDDFVGRYAMHCHNSVHEDHHMMATIRIIE